MPIPIKFAACAAGNALVDIDIALATAKQQSDAAADRKIWDLLTYFLEQLGGMSAEKLQSYLSCRNVWRQEGEAKIRKTLDEPCYAFAPLEVEGELQVLVLGCCYRYPGSEELWWQGVIRPRLRLYL